MSASADASPDEALVGGLYAVDPARPLPVADGAAAFAASRPGQPGAFMALEVPPGMAPRAAALRALPESPLPGLISPLAHGPATLPGRKPALYVICPSLPGPSLLAERPLWPARELITDVLRPAAAVLARLAARGLTHRAIRPGNLFRAGPGEPSVLGPAWAGPPASRQPPLYEPPYVAICPPSARGEGAIADDVYALGVTLLVLALGHEPMADLDAAEIVRRKLAFGSLAAILGENRLPPGIGDLARALLAEDPAHRPSPAALAEAGAGRIGLGVGRTLRRASEPLILGAEEAFVPRALAAAIGASPQHGVHLLRLGAVDKWLRRSFGDTALAHRIEDAVQQHGREAPEDETRADAFLAMRAAAILDPLAPLCWRGIWLWPDGLGPLLAEGKSLPALADLVDSEAISAWAACRPGRIDQALALRQARQNRMLLRTRGWAGGTARLAHALAPMLPCRSPLLGGRLVAELRRLLPALDAPTLDAAAAAAGGDEARLPIDAEIAAFILAHAGTALEPELAALPGLPSTAGLAVLRVFARLQEALGAGPLPRLASRLNACLAPSLAAWKERRRRAALEERLAALAGEGDLAAMLRLLEDPSARDLDAQGLKQADAAVRRIDAELAAIAAGAEARAETARRLGQEIAAGIGLVAVAATLSVLALG